MADIIPQTILNKAHVDKFVLVLDTPPVLKNYETKTTREANLVNLDKMQYSVISVTLPTHNIPPISVPYMGQTTHHTSQTRDEYPVVKVQFTVDNNYDNYWFIWKWLKIMNDPRNSGMDEHFATFTTEADQMLNKFPISPESRNIKYKHIKMVNKYTDYQTSIQLYNLREYNEKIIKFVYSNAFPVSLGELNLDYRETNEIACSFDFSYGQIDIELIDPV